MVINVHITIRRRNKFIWTPVSNPWRNVGANALIFLLRGGGQLHNGFGSRFAIKKALETGVQYMLDAAFRTNDFFRTGRTVFLDACFQIQIFFWRPASNILRTPVPKLEHVRKRTSMKYCRLVPKI